MSHRSRIYGYGPVTPLRSLLVTATAFGVGFTVGTNILGKYPPPPRRGPTTNTTTDRVPANRPTTTAKDQLKDMVQAGSTMLDFSGPLGLWSHTTMSFQQRFPYKFGSSLQKYACYILLKTTENKLLFLFIFIWG